MRMRRKSRCLLRVSAPRHTGNSTMDRSPVPFMLRSLETSHVHKMVRDMFVGRSAHSLDPEFDLVIGDYSRDVSAVHAKLQCDFDKAENKWRCTVVDQSGGGGVGQGPGGGHGGGGTSVDGVPIGVELHVSGADEPKLNGTFSQFKPHGGLQLLRYRNEATGAVIFFFDSVWLLHTSDPGADDDWSWTYRCGENGDWVHKGESVETDWVKRGKPNQKIEVRRGQALNAGMIVEPGLVLRFGMNELWRLEAYKLFPKSENALPALERAARLAQEEPSAMRELKVPSAQCHWALQRCDNWVSFVSVVLEWLDEPDEPPCADRIEIKDELGKTSARHQVESLDEMEAFDVKDILSEMNLGRTVRLRLTSDPQVLAPLLAKMEKQRLKHEQLINDRDDIPDH